MLAVSSRYGLREVQRISHTRQQDARTSLRAPRMTVRRGFTNLSISASVELSSALPRRAARLYTTKPPVQAWDSMPPGAEEMMTRMNKMNEPQDPQEDKRFGKGFSGGIGWGAFVVFCVVGGVVWWWGRKRRLEIEESRKRVQVAGEARIGGTWSLIDHDGKPVCSKDFEGKYPLIYFGFTYCPDICPIELKKMASALDMLPEEVKDKISPLMVSVDPWRDSVAHLKGYCNEFHPRLLGLVGTPQQTDVITRQFRVYTSKGPEEVEGDYLVDHSIFMYFMDKNGKFIDYYGVAMEAEEIAESMTNHLIARNELPEPGVLGSLKFWWANRNKKTL